MLPSSVFGLIQFIVNQDGTFPTGKWSADHMAFFKPVDDVSGLVVADPESSLKKARTDLLFTEDEFKCPGHVRWIIRQQILVPDCLDVRSSVLVIFSAILRELIGGFVNVIVRFVGIVHVGILRFVGIFKILLV
jgi:hypothetical protein